MYKNAVIAMMVIATLAVASCSGGAGAPLSEMDTDNVSNVNNTPAVQDDDLVSSTEWVAQSDQPVLPRESSDWFEIIPDLDPDFDFEWENIFELMHNSVSYGENDIPTNGYMGTGGGARYELTVVGWTNGGGFPSPVMGYGLVLESSAEQPAFATFGFTDFPAGNRIKKVELEGWGGDVWIGVAGFGSKDAYRWFGPYDLNEGAELTLPYMDSTNDANHGYMTLLTAGGDYATVTDIKVTVGEQGIIPEIEVVIPEIEEPIWEL